MGRLLWRHFDAALLLASLGMLGAFLGFVLLYALVPINNYLDMDGTVQFRREMSLTADMDGVVRKVHKGSLDSVRPGDVLLEVSARESEAALRALSRRIRACAREMETLRGMLADGLIDSVRFRRKDQECDELQVERENLENHFVRTRFGGFVQFNVPTGELVGSYLEKGQLLGYVFAEKAKEVKAGLPSHFVSRVRPGGEAVVQYRHPDDLLSWRLPGVVREIVLNKADNRMSVLVDLRAADSAAASLPSGTQVRVSILINRKSLLDDVLRVWRGREGEAGTTPPEHAGAAL